MPGLASLFTLKALRFLWTCCTKPIFGPAMSCPAGRLRQNYTFFPGAEFGTVCQGALTSTANTEPARLPAQGMGPLYLGNSRT